MYDPTDLTQTNGFLFFTRWITHYCAPVFVFLAGTSAFLVAQRKGKKYVSKFLFTRGLWLIFLEVVVVTFGWHFDVHFHEIDLQTIWSLGCSMLVLSALVHLPKRVILVIALLFIAGHNLLDRIHVPGQGLDAVLWAMVNDEHFFQYHSVMLAVAYPVLCWIGVMAAGYCAGEIYTNYEPVRRRKILLILGSIAVLGFIIIRYSNLYGDPSPWSVQKSFSFTLMSFVNVTKYPPSLLYVLMTIGPALIFLALMENSKNWFSNIVSTYGRVPMFYYLIHIYLIHLVAMLAARLSGYKWSDMISPGWIAFNPPLHGYGFSLTVVYLVWIGIIIFLYPFCRWYDKYKSTHRHYWWLSYL